MRVTLRLIPETILPSVYLAQYKPLIVYHCGTVVTATLIITSMLKN